MIQSITKEINLTDPTQGLDQATVERSAKNIPKHQVTDRDLAMQVMGRQIFSFFFVLLIISGILSVILHESVDAWLFFILAIINASIGFFQEFRASKSAQALASLVQHTVTVRRDGKLVSVQSQEIVLGDIVIGEPGDIIAADLLVRESQDLLLDESVLTGESMPQEKKVGDTVVAGTNIAQGSLVGQVVAVGADSSLFKYSDEISKTQKNSSFDHFVNRISRLILMLTVVCLIIVLVGSVLVTRSVTVPEYILYAISLLVSVVPEALPLVITMILTREALELSRQRVIVKRLSVLQNLGGMDCLFTDKTGTITENNLRMVRSIDRNHLMEDLTTIAQASYERTPMDAVYDKAIQAYTQIPEKIDGVVSQFSPFKIIRGYAVYTFPDCEIIRGQYAHVLAACAPDPSFADECLKTEQSGLRVIAIASRLPGASTYTLSGAAVFEDPLKPDAVAMYQKLHDLGIDVKIITGDSVAVATSVGEILDPSITTANVFSMDGWKPDGTDTIEGYRIYARCQSEQKSELINEHLDHGVVGFLGEGINDALALKRADIGFVVNNGSDVARQSGDVLLLERSLSPIVAAISLSRRAYIHIRTYLVCTLAGNIGTLISLTAVIVLWKQIPMLPIQILLNNLLTDLPLLLLITDTIDESLLNKPIQEHVRRFFTVIVAFAALSSLFDFIYFFAFKGYDLSILRTGWFIFSVIAELTAVYTLRSELPLFKSPKLSRPLSFALIICYIIAFILPFSPLGPLFHLMPLTLMQLGILGGITIIYLGANEFMKFILTKTH